MKALVLVGGTGTRPRPFGHATQRQLVTVANRPVLFFGLEAIRKSGISEIAIVVGKEDKAVRDAVGTGAAFGLDVTYIRQDAQLGLGHGVLIARDYLDGDDFLVLQDDSVILDGIPRLVEEFRRSDRPEALVMVGDVTGGGGRQTVVTVDGRGHVTGLKQGQGHPYFDRTLVGAYVFNPGVHQAILSTTPDWRRHREVTDVMAWLVANGGTVLAYSTKGYWNTLGCVDNLLDCNREVLSRLDPVVLGDVDDASELLGPVLVDAGASIKGSRVVGPAVVGVGTTVTDSVIGPHTSLGADCDIQASAIEHSIVLERASLRAVGPVRNSLIGRDAQVWAEPAGSRLILGDRSQVALPTGVVR
ncbi:sugar phosphate nucleotidyltransferase [Nonomuraea sp. NPDC000554]|uniref:sugar phosphate nucleotidyltransferase n=1 Tax=Nonomuraea sp. NPDC000554 TaxID=3154259 RepID=UPI003330AEA0